MATSEEPANGGQPNRKATFKAQIMGLNEQFASWVKDQSVNHSAELWTDGIKDYLNHVEGLLKEFSDLIDAERQAKRQGAPQTTPSASPAFSFGAAATPASSPSLFKNMPTTSDLGCMEQPDGVAGKKKRSLDSTEDDVARASPSAGFLFGRAPPSSTPAFGAASKETEAAPKLFTSGASASSPSADAEKKDAAEPPKPVFAFGGATKDSGAEKPAPFSFGGAASSTAAAGSDSAAATTSAPKPFTFGAASTDDGKKDRGSEPGVFNFGSAAGSAPAASAGFSFGSKAAPFSFGGGASSSTAPPGETGGEGGDDDEAPAKFESEVAVNEDAGTVVFKAKSKFLHFVKEGAGAWEGKGIGTLMIRQRADDPKKAIITFTTEAGRVLYITNLYKTMSVILSEAKPTASFSAPWSPDGSSPPTLQMVMFQLPKGKNVEFKAEIEQLQAVMA